MSGAPRFKTWQCKACKARWQNMRLRKCPACETRRPGKRVPKHRAVLRALSYEDFITINGGEFCGICGARPKEGGKRLHRDHDHKTGKPRGLLDFRCNSRLDYGVTPEWLRAAADYLERAA